MIKSLFKLNEKGNAFSFSFVDKDQLRLIDFLECLNYGFDTLAENV